MFESIRQWFHKKKEKLRDWMIRQAHTKRAQYILSVMAFTESSFFPIPPDFFMVPLIVAHKKAWWKFALNVTISSILGALLGYLIGIAFFDLIAQPLIDFYSLQEEVAHVGELFNNNAFTAIFLSAFTPIPFKVFTISAGIFKIKLVPFIFGTILGRGLRFFIEALIVRYLGDKVSKVIYRYFDIVTLLVILGILLYFVIR